MAEKTIKESREIARSHGEPTMELMFEKGKLFQRYELRVNPNNAKMNVWVEVQGQDNGAVS
jgi:hypothetical protein